MKQGMLLGLVLVLAAVMAAHAIIGGGEITFQVYGTGPVVFSHEKHAGVRKLACKECHYAVFINRANHKKATMADMQQGKSCGTCHNGKRAFDVADTRTCSKCHS